MKRTYEIHDLQPYINWAYFYHAWQLHNSEQQQKSRNEAEQTLGEIDGSYHVHALFQLFEANSDGDDIVLMATDNHQPITRIPLLRQQFSGSGFLCLSDFIRPLSSGVTDKIGIFATTVDLGMETDFSQDSYQKMMVQLLADRLAEAAAEKLHEEVRRSVWGYAPDEHLSIADMQAERFQGIRPAVGYPSLPDTSLNFVFDEILQFKQIGIRLTESGAMKPHASVSGMMMALPTAHYFSIGKIGEDQLCDYASRRGLPIEVVRKFLASNL